MFADFRVLARGILLSPGNLRIPGGERVTRMEDGGGRGENHEEAFENALRDEGIIDLPDAAALGDVDAEPEADESPFASPAAVRFRACPFRSSFRFWSRTKSVTKRRCCCSSWSGCGRCGKAHPHPLLPLCPLSGRRVEDQWRPSITLRQRSGTPSQAAR